MKTPIPWQNRLFLNLSALADRGGGFKHLAYFCSGWLSLFRVSPQMGSSATNGLTVALGLALLVAVLWVSAPVINAMQPAFRAAGQLSAGQLSSLALALLSLWRYAVGRTLLRDFQATLPAPPAEQVK